ncbi:MAG: nucleotidyltransferase domain-containing protein [Deltaproteobacteria bacterium]|nr:nucleotidyltransferase domain-containing protein [Deltaproteobacteria bacterium]
MPGNDSWEKRLPEDILQRLTSVVPLVSSDLNVQALYLFGSGAQDRLRPLIDLDFGILLATRLDRKQRSEKQVELAGKLNDFFGTEEIDLVILNDVPPRFSIKVVKEG